MVLEDAKQQQLVDSLTQDVSNLEAYAQNVDAVAAGNDRVVATVNARLDAYFTRCQALLDDVNRFEQPLLYYRLIGVHRKLFALYQRWD